MRQWLFATALIMIGLGSARASVQEVLVPYGEWTALPGCGGESLMICPDSPGGRQASACRIEFRFKSRCNLIDLYTNSNYTPNLLPQWYPVTPSSGPRTQINQTLKRSFDIQTSEFSGGTDFYVLLHNSDLSQNARIHYHYNL